MITTFMWGGLIGLGILVAIISLVIGRRPDPRSDEPCECITCAGARAWAERYRGYQ